MRTAFLLLVFTATALQGWAQNAENRQISLEMKNEPLGSALKQFSNVSGYKVNFPSEDVAPYRVCEYISDGSFCSTSEDSGRKAF